MLRLREGRNEKVSFLILFAIIWTLVFAVILFIGSTMPYSEFLIQTAIFSAMIAFLIALFCFFAGGGTRDHRELTDGITVVGI